MNFCSVEKFGQKDSLHPFQGVRTRDSKSEVKKGESAMSQPLLALFVAGSCVYIIRSGLRFELKVQVKVSPQHCILYCGL